jgi:hypothetical protein
MSEVDLALPMPFPGAQNSLFNKARKHFPHMSFLAVADTVE